MPKVNLSTESRMCPEHHLAWFQTKPKQEAKVEWHLLEKFVSIRLHLKRKAISVPRLEKQMTQSNRAYDLVYETKLNKAVRCEALGSSVGTLSQGEGRNFETLVEKNRHHVADLVLEYIKRFQ